jgi:hypothetical protein
MEQCWVGAVFHCLAEDNCRNLILNSTGMEQCWVGAVFHCLAEDNCRNLILNSTGMERNMKIAMASDHAGFSLKEEIKAYLQSQGHEVLDFGAHSEDACDLPDSVYPALLRTLRRRGITSIPGV